MPCEGAFLGINASSVLTEKAKLDLAEFEKSRIIAELENHVAHLFLDLELYRQAINLWKAVEPCSVDNLQSIEEKVQRGMLSRVELFSAQEEAYNIKYQIVSTEKQTESIELEIRNICNLESEEIVTGKLLELIDAEILLPLTDKLIDLAKKNNHDISVLKSEKNMMEQEYQSAWKKNLPIMNLSGSYQRVGDFDQGGGTDQFWDARLDVVMNLWESGASKAVMAQKKISFEKSEAELKNKINEIQLQIKNACNAIDVLKVELQRTNASLNKLKYILDETLSQVQAGLSDPSDLCDAKKTYIETLQEQMGIKQQIKSNIFDLRTFLGLTIRPVQW